MILKAYTKNDKFEKSFREIHEKNFKNFVKIWVNEISNLDLETKNDSKPKPAEDNGKKEEKGSQNAEPKLDNLKQKDNFYEPCRSLLRHPSVTPAYNYISPKRLEEDQSQEYNDMLILRMTRLVE